MKKSFLVAMVVTVMLTAGVVNVDATDKARLVEYRVVSEAPVQLGQVVDLFIPGLSGGNKFLSPNANGIGLIRQWNPRLAGATWKTPLQQGEILRLPAEWVLRGIQGVLEPVASVAPLMEYNPSPLVGAHAWLMVVGVALIITPGGLWLFHRLGWM